ncbi:immunoglobulin variable region used by the ITC63B heavy chain [Rhypophila sp. PSN 637]
MEDAVRPSKEAFKAMYERGYRLWTSLWEMASAENPPWQDHLTSLGSVFHDHPHFPESLTVDKSFSNTATVSGRTTWIPAQAPCDLLPFHERVVIEIASSCATTIVFVDDRLGKMTFSNIEFNHVPILMLAWAYILSARWAELIPGANPPSYSSNCAQLNAGNGSKAPDENCDSVVVDVGDVDEDAARWWTAVLAADGGWEASIYNNNGILLYAPWSTRTQPGPTFVVSANVQHHSYVTNHHPASFSTAIRYLSEYCSLHRIVDQCQAALSAALLIPVAKFENRRIELPIPRLPQKATCGRKRTQAFPAWGGEICQLDRLLTLSCNSTGIKALLSSIFFEPDVACNVCGAWLQGSFAFLDSDKARDRHVLLRTFMKRDPDLGFLWLGAFITGAESRCLQDARTGWWKVDLTAAACTGTHASFIQEFIRKDHPIIDQITRADECRLMYLSHESDHAVPPLFPFAPFGSTAMVDTDLNVRRHSGCSAAHGLGYGGFTWDCQDGKKVEQRTSGARATTIRVKGREPPGWKNTAPVDYGMLDPEEDVSEMVTRNVFTWLRGEDGFPVAERAICEHEWIRNLESDDDSPIEGDAWSTTDDQPSHKATAESQKKQHVLWWP